MLLIELVENRQNCSDLKISRFLSTCRSTIRRDGGDSKCKSEIISALSKIIKGIQVLLYNCRPPLFAQNAA
jgi:hypothetical protein